MSARKNDLGKILRWRRKWGGRWPDFAKRKAAERRGKSSPAEQGEEPCLDPDKMHGAADGFPGEDLPSGVNP